MSSSPPKLPKRPAPISRRDSGRLDGVRRRLTFIEIPHISQEMQALFNEHVRLKYLRYKPTDLVEMDSEQLLHIVNWYRPASQPRNFYEWSYFELMATTAEKLISDKV